MNVLTEIMLLKHRFAGDLSAGHFDHVVHSVHKDNRSKAKTVRRGICRPRYPVPLPCTHAG